jgi:tetratricopeptide (TPR) repeat protein
MRNVFLLLTVLALLSPAICQERVQMNTIQARPSGESTEPEKPRVLSKDELRRVQQLLESAEAGSAALDAPSRIVAYTELAHAYQNTDPKKTTALLERALAATRDLQFESADARLNDRLQRQLENRLVGDFAALAPERLDALVDEVPAQVRARAVDQLIPYYAKTKQLRRANDLVMRAAQENEMPYAPASALMSLYPAQADEVRSLFLASLASYQAHEHGGMSIGNDFPEMIAKFHEQLPPAVLKPAVDEVLSQAKKADEKQDGGNVSIGSDKGAVSFNSIYDYRLFQLLPTLRRIDPQTAERLLKDRQDVNTLASKYPDGMNSLRGSDGAGGNMMMSMGSGAGGGGGRGGPGGPSPMEMQRVAQISEDAQKHPQQALANAASLSPETAIHAFMSIARVNHKSDPGVARLALSKASALIEKVALEEQLMNSQMITDLYLKMGETDKAKDSLEQALTIADRLYKQDTDADDPNLAPKAYWASTNGYRSVLSRAGKLDPAWATNLLKDVPDDGIRVFDQIAMANAIAGGGAGGFQIISATKNGVKMMFMNSN